MGMHVVHVVAQAIGPQRASKLVLFQVVAFENLSTIELLPTLFCRSGHGSGDHLVTICVLEHPGSGSWADVAKAVRCFETLEGAVV